MTGGRYAIRGARILVDGVLERREILIHRERIAEIAPEVDPQASTLDAAGLVALPGVIDAHVHFREPGLTHKEDWASGSRAALAGGVTTVLDMPNTSPPTTSLAALADKRYLASQGSLVDFGLFFGLTEHNLAEALRAEGVAGLKLYMGASTGGLLVTSDEALDRVFAEARYPVVVHAEEERILRERRAAWLTEPSCVDHGVLRGIEAAVEATRRAIDMAWRNGARLHVAHLSTGAELDLVEQARRSGVRVTCEVAPHHLLLDESYVLEHGCRGKVNPPLRPAAEREALWRRLSQVDMIATDHAPHLPSEKDLPYERAAAGLPSVELYLPLLLDCVAAGRLSLSELVRLSATGPASVFGMTSKGRLEPGFDADIALVDLDAERVVDSSKLYSKCGWSPYTGRTLRGWPVMTLVRGHMAFGPKGFEGSRPGQEVAFRPAGG